MKGLKGGCEFRSVYRQLGHDEVLLRFNDKVKKTLIHFVRHSAFAINPNASPFLATDFVEALSVNDDRPLGRSLMPLIAQLNAWLKMRGNSYYRIAAPNSSKTYLATYIYISQFRVFTLLF